MKLPRPAWFVTVVLPFLAGGCCCYDHEHYDDKYTELRVTNPRGEVIADWVARGHISHTETGYRITAVQRTDGYPYPVTARYPDGWQVTVVGPNVHRWPCARPEWMDSDRWK